MSHVFKLESPRNPDILLKARKNVSCVRSAASSRSADNLYATAYIAPEKRSTSVSNAAASFALSLSIKPFSECRLSASEVEMARTNSSSPKVVALLKNIPLIFLKSKEPFPATKYAAISTYSTTLTPTAQNCSRKSKRSFRGRLSAAFSRAYLLFSAI